MQPSEVLKVKLNVKQHTANLKVLPQLNQEILSKASKDQSSAKSEDLDGGISHWGSEAEVAKLTVAKWSVGQLKELTRNEQALVKSKSHQEDKHLNRDLASSSYRSKYRANETALRLNSRKSTPLAYSLDELGFDELEDQGLSMKKISFHQVREIPSESIIKYKTKDNFFTPKMREGSELHPTTQTKIRGRSTNKIDRQPKVVQERAVLKVDDEVVLRLKESVKKLSKSRDELQAELQEYKTAIVRIAQQCKKLESEVQKSKLDQNVIQLLQEELTAERTRSREALWQLRIQQQKLLDFKQQLLGFYEKQEQGNRTMLGQINQLSYQNRALRLMLHISGDKFEPPIETIADTFGQQQQLKKLNLFWNGQEKLNARDYLLKKLEELKGSACRPVPPKQEKKAFNFKICMLPANPREEDRDIYEDEAFMKKMGGTAARSDQQPSNS